jgi:hypothetical protein
LLTVLTAPLEIGLAPLDFAALLAGLLDLAVFGLALELLEEPEAERFGFLELLLFGFVFVFVCAIDTPLKVGSPGVPAAALWPGPVCP